MYKLAIFDFDGTLVDSAPGICQVMTEVADELSMSAKALEKWKTLIGVPLDGQVRMILPEESSAVHQQISDRYRAIYNARAVDLCPPFPHLLESLAALRENSIRITIATSKRRKVVELVLEHYELSSYFDLIIGSEDVNSHKPHPESVLVTLEKLNFERPSAVVIGDSNFDLEMARNAEVDSIGVTTGVHSHDVLHAEGPLSIHDNLGDATREIITGRNKAANTSGSA